MATSLKLILKKEVDEWTEKVKKAGGTIFFDPRKFKNKFYEENGYYVCHFADPDGHLFNVFLMQLRSKNR